MATSFLVRMAKKSGAGLYVSYIPLLKKSGILGAPRIYGFLLKIKEF